MASSLRVLAAVRNGVAVVELSGIATVDSIRWAFGEIGRQLAGQSWRVTLGDYRRSVFAITPDDLASIMAPMETPQATKRPTVLVVAPPALPLLIGYARTVAQAGYVRRVVTSIDAAHDWARETAALEAVEAPAYQALHAPDRAGQQPPQQPIRQT